MPDSTKRCPYCDEEISVNAIKCKHCGSMLVTPPTGPYDTLDLPLAGTPTAADRIFSGRYKIVKELGRGGMGVVYLAHDEELDMEVAVKFLPIELADDPRALEQLRSEAKLSMTLSHDNIMRLHNLDTSGQLKFIVMEYINGPSLLDMLREKERLSLEEALPIIRAICDGLEYAHSKRIVHRDLKPANVMLTADGSVKVTDFGIARQMRESMSKLSQKTISGTPAYMAPEHLMGEHLTVRSDVYSLGAVAYELLAGHPPFYRGDIATQIRFKEPPPIPGIPDTVNQAIARALAKKAEDRPGSAREFYDMLAEALTKAGPQHIAAKLPPTIKLPPASPPKPPSEEYVIAPSTSKPAAAEGEPPPPVAASEAATPKEPPAAPKPASRRLPTKPVRSSAWLRNAILVLITLGFAAVIVIAAFDPFSWLSEKIPVKEEPSVPDDAPSAEKKPAPEGLRVPQDCATIQEALDKASDGDTVLVADGTYKGEGNKNIDFKGKAVTLKSENGAGKCIIDCDYSGRGFHFHSGETAKTVVEGFTVQHGKFVTEDGGAIRCSGASPTIKNCLIVYNIAQNGNGIYCEKDSNPSIVNCVIADNAGWYGGGLYCIRSRPTLTNCTIARNGEGMIRGGGVYCEFESHVILNNTILWGNYTTEKGSQIFTGKTSSVTLRHCCLPDDLMDPMRFGGNGQINEGHDCIHADPLMAGTGTEAYRLLPGSPCIDGGGNALLPVGISASLGNHPRVANGTVDIGAYEYPGPFSPSAPKEVFGKMFSHESHKANRCDICHIEEEKGLSLALMGRAGCNACHHESVESSEDCNKCHSVQREFFAGSAKFGLEELPSMKFDSEMGCDTCHGDMKRYEPTQVRVSCSNCHEKGDEDYNYKKLVGEGKKALEQLQASLAAARGAVDAALKKGAMPEQFSDVNTALTTAGAMLDFLKKDGSFGIHNPFLFEEYQIELESLLETVTSEINKLTGSKVGASPKEDSRYAEAMKRAKELLDKEPNVPFADSADRVMESAKKDLPDTPRMKELISSAAAALASYRVEQNDFKRTKQLYDKKVATSSQVKHAEFNLEKAEAKLEHLLRLLQHELDGMRYDKAAEIANEALRFKPDDPEAKSLLEQAQKWKDMLTGFAKISATIEGVQVTRVELERAKATLDLTQQLYDSKYASESELSRVRTAFEDAECAYTSAGTSLEAALRTPAAVVHSGLRRQGVIFLLDEARHALAQGDVDKAKSKVKWALIIDPENNEAKSLLEQIEALQGKLPHPEREEAAVADALKWLSSQQQADGRWKAAGTGNTGYDVGVSGFTLLAFISGGNTHRSGSYKDTVSRCIDWLKTHQHKDGSFRDNAGSGGAGWMYGHAIATVALCGAYVSSGDDNLRNACEQAVSFIVRAQNSDGGWRYAPATGTSDSSVTGYMLLALRMATLGGITVPAATSDAALKWLDQMTGDDGKTSYVKGSSSASIPLTATSVFDRLVYDVSKEDTKIKKGIEFLAGRIPSKARSDIYSWFWTANAMTAYGGEDCLAWFSALRKVLLEGQKAEGEMKGSWEPDGVYTKSGGRVLSTALGCLCMEACYRYFLDHRPVDVEPEEDKAPEGEGGAGALGVGGGGAAGAFGYRSVGSQKRQVLRMGGSHKSQNAVELALQWLERHQDNDGKWDQDGFNSHCDKEKGSACEGNGVGTYDVGVTGLALLAFLGSGHTHTAGKYKETVKKGIDWLLRQQVKNGIFKTMKGDTSWAYEHAIATWALCEAYGMTGDNNLKEPCQRAVNHIHKHQNTGFGWRYEPRSGMNDTSVTGWMVHALRTAKIVGLDVKSDALKGATTWLDRATNKDGRTGYMRPGDSGAIIRGVNDKFEKQPAMTAVALSCRLFLGQPPTDEKVRKGAAVLLNSLPDWGKRKTDLYYWFWGTSAAFHYGGDLWKQWNRAVREILVEKQLSEGCARGSWDPVGKWGMVGGRVYSTALCCLMLEVYYRYMPVSYKDKKGGEKPGEGKQGSLDGTGSIAGKVVLANGRPVYGTPVTLYRMPGGEPAGFTHSDQSGMFRFEILEPGNYSVYASRPDAGTATTALTVSRGARTSTNLVLKKK